MAQNSLTSITFDASDIGMPGNRYGYLSDTTTTNFTPGPGGSGQTWNFVGLAGDETDTMTIHNILNTPYASAYPNGDLVSSNTYGVDIILSNDAGALSILNQEMAVIQGVFRSTYFAPDTLLQYNANLYDNWSDTSSYALSFFFGDDPGNGVYADSMRIVSCKREYTMVDGEGTCITESGSYACLRLVNSAFLYEYVEVYQNGAWVYFTDMGQSNSINYTWWSESAGMYVAQCDLDPVTLESIYITRLTYLETPSGITEISRSSAKAFPNPATDVLTFETGVSEGSVEVIDLSGRIVKTAVINSTITQINVSDLASGMYTYRVNGVTTGKVQVAH